MQNDSLKTQTVAAVLILIFIYSAVNKIIDWKSFMLSLQSSPFIGKNAYTAAWIILFIHFVAAGLLFLPVYRLKGFCLSFIYTLFCSVYISTVLLMNVPLPCSCIGLLRSLSWQQQLFLNIILSLWSVTGILFYKRLVHQTKTT